jgi:Na+-driven multidrug efflux pump
LLSLGGAVSVYAGQNYGARNLKRVKAGIKAGTVLSLACAVLLASFLLLFSKPLTVLFVGEGKDEIYRLSRMYLTVNGSFYMFLGLLYVFRSTIQGVGRNLFILIGGAVELVCRIFIVVISQHFDSYLILCFCSALTWLVTSVYFAVCYFVIIKKVVKKESGGAGGTAGNTVEVEAGDAAAGAVEAAAVADRRRG